MLVKERCKEWLSYRRIGAVIHRGHFDASHHLPRRGNCENLHGHTYRVEIEVSGSINNGGVIMDFSALKSAYKRFDHVDLNTIFPGDYPPTAENICWAILQGVRDQFHEPSEAERSLYSIRVQLWEGLNNYVEFVE